METKVKKHSYKRDAILNILMNTKKHPTAEMVYSSLKNEIPDLSLATVYRNINQFVSEGKLIKVCSVNGNERFDANVYTHSHFVCKKCTSVIDLPEFYGEMELDNQLSTVFDGKIDSHQLVFYGLCKDCII